MPALNNLGKVEKISFSSLSKHKIKNKWIIKMKYDRYLQIMKYDKNMLAIFSFIYILLKNNFHLEVHRLLSNVLTVNNNIIN